MNLQNDSNLQQFTFEQGEIRVKIDKSGTNGLFSTRYLKMSHSSRTLVGPTSNMEKEEINNHKDSNGGMIPTSQELLIINQQLLNEEAKEDFKSLNNIVKVPPS